MAKKGEKFFGGGRQTPKNRFRFLPRFCARTQLFAPKAVFDDDDLGKTCETYLIHL
jgi:hypothetical protein